jgi:hypothetical protein
MLDLNLSTRDESRRHEADPAFRHDKTKQACIIRSRTLGRCVAVRGPGLGPFRGLGSQTLQLFGSVGAVPIPNFAKHLLSSGEGERAETVKKIIIRIHSS